MTFCCAPLVGVALPESGGQLIPQVLLLLFIHTSISGVCVLVEHILNPPIVLRTDLSLHPQNYLLPPPPPAPGRAGTLTYVV